MLDTTISAKVDAFIDAGFFIALCLALAIVSGAVLWAVSFCVRKYVEKSGCARGDREELLFSIILAAGSIAFMLLFAFQQIIDIAGLYFLSVSTPIIAYFIATGIIAFWLGRQWNPQAQKKG